MADEKKPATKKAAVKKPVAKKAAPKKKVVAKKPVAKKAAPAVSRIERINNELKKIDMEKTKEIPKPNLRTVQKASAFATVTESTINYEKIQKMIDEESYDIVYLDETTKSLNSVDQAVNATLETTKQT